jgi:hypothetical protein
MDVLNYNFIRLGLTPAKALQTASRLKREMRRRFAVPKSNAFTLPYPPFSLAIGNRMVDTKYPGASVKASRWVNSIHVEHYP